jgi:hypothetical protein
MASSKKITRNYETPKHGQASNSSARMNFVNLVKFFLNKIKIKNK